MTRRRADLLRLGRMFVDDDTLAAELELALDDPEAHLKRHAARWKRRGLARAGVALPKNFAWLAFIDGLVARGRVAELDHRADVEEVVAACRALASAPAPEVLESLEEAAGDGGVEDVIAALARSLASGGLAIVRLERVWDAVAFALVPSEAADAMVSLAQRAGFGKLVRVEPAASPSVEAPRRTRRRGEGVRPTTPVNAPKSFEAFCAEHAFRNTDALMYGLQWKPDAASWLEPLQSVLPSAPAAERARLGYWLAMLVGSPASVAREADDPRACFAAVDAVARWQGRETEGFLAARQAGERATARGMTHTLRRTPQGVRPCRSRRRSRRRSTPRRHREP
ncbi:MAG: hypothetical protein U0230_24930 [Polyangiales bacterium]